MITGLMQKEIDDNYIRFTTLLKSVKREGVEDLVKYLETTDFFEAPASTRYHGNFKGGLCAHSLKVFDILKKLVNDYIELGGDTGEMFPGNEKEDSIILTALLHDVSKVNIYEETVSNKKVYSPEGSKYDELGNYDWKSVKSYKKKDIDQIFVAGNHEETSEFIVRQFIPLHIEESIAIAHHHGGIGYDSIDISAVGPIMEKYPLTLLLSTADQIAAYKFI